MSMRDTLTTIGSLLGILAFVWKLWDAFSAYLHIRLEVRLEGHGQVNARTTVENKGVFAKRVDNAVILIGPEAESPIDTFNALGVLPHPVGSTNEIAAVRAEKAIFEENGRALIPLPFYYSENIAIGDELLNYTAPISTQTFRPGVTYSVRFFLWTSGRYHRSTQDCFALPSITEPNAAPNGGPARPSGNSSITEGPPSVS